MAEFVVKHSGHRGSRRLAGGTQQKVGVQIAASIFGHLSRVANSALLRNISW
jgi:hypothetical protein